MCIDGNKAVRMANNDDVSISSQLIAIDNLPGFDGPDRSALGNRNVDTIMEIRSPRSETRIDRSTHGPNKSFKRVLYRFDGFDRVWPGEKRFGGGDDLNRKLSPRAGDKDLLTDANLTRLFDAIDSGQFLIADIVGFADAKQILAFFDHVIETLRWVGWRG